MKGTLLLSLCPHCVHTYTQPVASWGNPRIKVTAWHAKPPDFSSSESQPAITFRLGQQTLWWGNPPSPKCTNSDEDIQTIQIHIWSVFVHTLQSWKCRYSQDEAGTLFLKQAPLLHRCSVIISTMTVWVYTKCLSGGFLLSGETGSLFLCLTHLHYRSQCCCRLLPSVGRERWSLWISEELCIYVLYLWSCY